MSYSRREDKEENQVDVNFDDSQYTEKVSKGYYGLQEIEQARALLELVQRSLVKSGMDSDHILHIGERADGLFDLIVLERVS
jgi:hypothetical protein